MLLHKLTTRPFQVVALLVLMMTIMAYDAQAFTCRPPTVHGSRRYQSTSSDDSNSSNNDNNNNDLFTSEAWIPILEDLDRVPIFAVANPQGYPLAYKVETSKGTFEVPTFFCDIDAARQELSHLRDEINKKGDAAEGIDLIPFPLGKAFELWGQDQAVIVPGQNAILQAGAPPGTKPIGQQVPMFACMEIMEEREDGTGVLPLFMALEDANQALREAVQADDGVVKVEDFEVVSLSLNRAVELLATVPDSPAFHFIPDSRSMKYIQDYLS